MRAHEIAAQVAEFEQRGPGTDAERRAAAWLAREAEDPRREVRIEPFWCRPNWALAHAWHVALAIAGSLAAVTDPQVGAVLLLAALVSITLDALVGVSPGRRLTFERASQNVVARAAGDSERPGSGSAPADRPVRLLVTANYDAGRAGVVYREGWRSLAARLRRATGDFAPGWLGWLAVGIVWLLVIAVLRHEGHRSIGVGIAQFVPTVALVLTLAALLELATAGYGPAANDNGSGAALALALVRALDAAPPRHMSVELVLQGAGEGGGIGMRAYLHRRRVPSAPRTGRGGIPRRRHRPELGRANSAVIAFGACGTGALHWWISDGPEVPLRFSPRMRELCASLGLDNGASPHRGRGTTPALPARLARLPAIALGCLDPRGIVPRSHRPEDRAADLDPAALDTALEFALILVDALDSSLAQAPAAAPALAQP